VAAHHAGVLTRPFTFLLLPGVWASRNRARRRERGDLLRGLAVTILLGLIFSGFQMYEYHHAAFGFKDTVYASTFYMATGFHGAHVIIGTIFLIVCFFRAKKDHFAPADHFGFEAAAWYWHFVDVVWLFLFAAIYVWGAGAHAGAH
jgi:cytochrome c oxidase subunit 3